MSVRKWLITAGLVATASISAPRNASADWVFTPFVGWNFKGNADVSVWSSFRVRRRASRSARARVGMFRFIFASTHYSLPSLGDQEGPGVRDK